MSALPAFTVYRDRFPFGSPDELDVVHAATIAEARSEARRRWPGVALVVTKAPKKRSASSAAYRAFLATKAKQAKQRARHCPDKTSGVNSRGAV